MGVESAVKETADAALAPVKNIVKGGKGKRSIWHTVGAIAGLLLLAAVLIRYRSQIFGFVVKVPILGPLLVKLAGLG